MSLDRAGPGRARDTELRKVVVDPVMRNNTLDRPTATRPRQRAAHGVAKRALDIVVGSTLAVLTLPVLLVVAAAAAIALRAWPFFVQYRPSDNGRNLRIIKIRTLPRHFPRYATKFQLAKDISALPAVVQLMRSTHLDELPQLWLVPFGQMSLVGPRPALPCDVEPTATSVHRMRTSVRQGCTGLWQISDAANGEASSAPDLDAFYVANASVRLDLWILARTVPYMLGLARPISLSDLPSWVVRTPVLPVRMRPAMSLIAPLPAEPISLSLLTDLDITQVA